MKLPKMKIKIELGFFEVYIIELINVLKGHQGPVTHLIINEYFLFSGSDDLNIIKWKLNFDNLKNNKLIESKNIIKAHDDVITGLILHSDNCKLISGSFDKTIKIWDLKSLSNEVTIKDQNKILDIFYYDKKIISMELTIK